MNRTELTASLVERKVLRYSPAGVPILDLVLKHGSMQLEAGQMRQIELQIKAVAAGPIATELNQATLEQQYRFTGFLAPRTKNSNGIVFHVTTFELN